MGRRSSTSMVLSLAVIFLFLLHPAASSTTPTTRVCVVVNDGAPESLLFRSTGWSFAPVSLPKAVVKATKVKSTLEKVLRKDGRFKPVADLDTAEVVLYVEMETTRGPISTAPLPTAARIVVRMIPRGAVNPMSAPTTRLMAIVVPVTVYRTEPRDGSQWLKNPLWQGLAYAPLGDVAPFETLARRFAAEYTGQAQFMVTMVTPVDSSSSGRTALPKSSLPSLGRDGVDTTVYSQEDLASIREEGERLRESAQRDTSPEAVGRELGTLLLREHPKPDSPREPKSPQ